MGTPVDNNPLAEPSSNESDSEAIQKILARWPDLELLLERSGKQDQLVAELQSYIADLRGEAKTIKTMRTAMTWAAGAYVIFANLLLICLLFYHQFFFFSLGSYGRPIMILAVFSSSVILIAKILAGLFRTHGDRNKDEMLPPHIKLAMEAYNASQS